MRMLTGTGMALMEESLPSQLKNQKPMQIIKGPISNTNDTIISNESARATSSSNSCEATDLSRPTVACTDGSSLKKIKSLADIYNTCSFALNVIYQLNFNEVVKYKEWKDAMDVELSAIQGNNT